MALKNVVAIGASGNLGGPVLQQLLAAPELNVTVLTRPNSSLVSSPPANLQNPVVTSEYTDEATLTAAFKNANADAVLSLVGAPALGQQVHFINAAIAAGVKRFIPSEFGSDLDNPRAAGLPVFKAKVDTRKYLEEKAREGKIEWTAVSNGLFLEIAIKFFTVKPETNTAILYDGGEVPFSTTLIKDIGTAVANILLHPELPETKNKLVYINTAVTTQKKLVDIYQRVVGGEQKVRVESAKTEDVEKRGLEKLKNSDPSAFTDFVIRAIWGEGYGGDYTGKEISEKLGVRRLDDGGLEGVVRSVLGK